MSNDPNRRKPKGPQPGNDDDNRKARRIVMLIVAALIATLLINSLYTTISNAYLTEITYTEFKELLASDQISEVEFQSDDRIVILTKDQAEKPKSQQRLYYTGLIPNITASSPRRSAPSFPSSSRGCCRLCSCMRFFRFSCAA